MEIKKIENCDYVMLPRLQRPGMKPEHVERDAFKAELRHVEGRGDFWLLFQQSKPHVVAHVQLPKSEAEFDQILGFCLGQNKWCEYIEGDLSFLRERVYALCDAARWWYEYGKVLINPK